MLMTVRLRLILRLFETFSSIPTRTLVSTARMFPGLTSAFGVIYTSHRARELFRELELLRRDENEIQIGWRQLLLERSAAGAEQLLVLQVL